MKKVNLSKMRNRLAHYLVEAPEEDVVIMKRGKPVGVIIKKPPAVLRDCQGALPMEFFS
jgi:prevent-host-death family protein